jgi:hypothetical protein
MTRHQARHCTGDLAMQMTDRKNGQQPITHKFENFAALADDDVGQCVEQGAAAGDAAIA